MSDEKQPTDLDELSAANLERRKWLKRSALAIGALGAVPAIAAKKNDPRKQPAAIGDELWFPSWENDGRRLELADLVVGAPPLLVYPRDPVSGVVRERSRLNQILVMRFGLDDLAADDPVRQLDGIVAYSGLCTHTACAVSEWNGESRLLLCPCHGSEFDPLDAGKRINGPATRSLPGLPLALKDNYLVIAGAFTSKVGASA